jgi:hypothetical protein
MLVIVLVYSLQDLWLTTFFLWPDTNLILATFHPWQSVNIQSATAQQAVWELMDWWQWNQPGKSDTRQTK